MLWGSGWPGCSGDVPIAAEIESGGETPPLQGQQERIRGTARGG
jgi:hypothetical protein